MHVMHISILNTYPFYYVIRQTASMYFTYIWLITNMKSYK
jgi:hypothetical protein